ncbi:CCAAT/enhancer-binding protein gamma [Ctenocephalides felis]|uniref:CCAAT/enhancer-binding protein gamma n=1 Tax=Ctenocephalides felis TaxID=7515 RepID=UPI000E6E2552|nr:CCAAT/enhancer-binding protein gamma [Ctenocephalides felis]
MTMAPRKDSGKSAKKKGNDDDDEYRKKRERNNEAVKKSRVKSKQKTLETMDRVAKLKNENQVLEDRVQTLTKELSFLKELFLLHASQKGEQLKPSDIARVLSDDVTGSSTAPTTSSSSEKT